MAQKDAWRAYYELALGLTETSRKKAVKIVKNVAGKGGGTADQLQELVNTAVANREAISRMVKVEIDRALGRIGLATMEEVDELTKRVRDLERELAATKAAGPADASSLAASPPAGATAKKAVAKKAVAKKAVAKKTTSKKVTPTKAMKPEKASVTRQSIAERNR